MPFVNIKLLGKLTREQKQEIVKGITELLQKVAGKDPKVINIVIEELERENWGKEGKLLG